MTGNISSTGDLEADNLKRLSQGEAIGGQSPSQGKERGID